MLKIYYGRDIDDAIYDTSVYFKNCYEPEWIVSEFAKAAILDIDKSTVLSKGCIDSPVFGSIPPERLSEGVKTVILMYNEPETIFNASACGDNCAKWIMEIAKEKDITINLRHLMDFSAVGEFPVDVEVLNNHKIVHNDDELFWEAANYI